MEKIQTLSCRILVIINILIVGVPILAIVTWLGFKTSLVQSLIQSEVLFSPVQLPSGSVNLTDVNWSVLGFLIVVFGSALSTITFVATAMQFRRVFQNYSMGRVFNLEITKSFRIIGWIAILWGAVISSVVQTLNVLGITLSNPPGKRLLSVSFGSPQLSYLVIGFAIIIVSYVMMEGAKLNQDQRLTI